MRRLAALAAVLGLAAAGFAYVHTTEPGWWVRLWYPLKYEGIVRGHARNYRLDPALLAAVIYQESKFRADVKSESGAIGLMQLLPDTAKGIAIHTGGTRFRVQDLYNPELNVRYGSWYLRHLLDKYDDERTALAAYNAGQENVDEWRRDSKGIPFPETRHYVKRVERLKTLYRRGYFERVTADVRLMFDKQHSDVIMTSQCSCDRSSKACSPISRRSRQWATTRLRTLRAA